MENDRFDALTRSLGASSSRRSALGVTLGGVLGALGLGLDAAAAKKRKRKKQCRGGKKKCGKRCIPKSQCCTSANCGFQGACLKGACLCLSGARFCQGRCIPEAACCTDGECLPGSGQTCQGGTCACPAGQELSGGECGPRPICRPRHAACTDAAQCCSDNCAGTSACGCSGADEPCFTETDCCENQPLSCHGFVCKTKTK